MQNNKFLLEIGVEELPARHCQSILRQLNKDLMKRLPKLHNLKFDNCNIYITPRRIVFLADNLSQVDTVKHIRGPIYDVAFDDDKPNHIAEKFAQSHNRSVEDIEIREDKDKKFLFLTKDLSNQFHKQIQNFLIDVINQLHFDRAMKWDDSSLEFSRPIRWINCLLGKKVVDLKLGKLHSGNTTFGNRFQSSPEIKIKSADKYIDDLAANFVMIKQADRRNIIDKALLKLGQDNLKPCDDITDDLINEVTYLVEWPVFILCRFDKEFLKLPQEIIISVLSKHQRYFPIFNKDNDEISHNFMTISNHKERSDIIKQGNEKVIRARLNDAAFFFEQDLKHDLDYFYKRTKTITFQEKLGSMMDKTKRLTQIAPEINKVLDNTKSISNKTVQQAAKYCKADLATAMVSEFTSLEGTVGRIYAEIEDYENIIAKAIEQHYLPRHSGDNLPDNQLGLILALADRIDTLYGMFSIDIKPKGNSDPYGLRRAAIAVTRILWEKELDISLDELITTCSNLFANTFDTDELKLFLQSRLEQYLQDNSALDDTTLIRAIVYSSTSSFKFKKKILHQIKQLHDDNIQKFEDLMEIIKRIYNIAIKGDKKFENIDPIDADQLNKSEKDIFDIIQKLKNTKPDIPKLIDATNSINEFFENNMVMAKDKTKRNIRLTLLNELYEQINEMVAAEQLFT